MQPRTNALRIALACGLTLMLGLGGLTLAQPDSQPGSQPDSQPADDKVVVDPGAAAAQPASGAPVNARRDPAPTLRQTCEEALNNDPEW